MKKLLFLLAIFGTYQWFSSSSSDDSNEIDETVEESGYNSPVATTNDREERNTGKVLRHDRKLRSGVPKERDDRIRTKRSGLARQARKERSERSRLGSRFQGLKAPDGPQKKLGASITSAGKKAGKVDLKKALQPTDRSLSEFGLESDRVVNDFEEWIRCSGDGGKALIMDLAENHTYLVEESSDNLIYEFPKYISNSPRGDGVQFRSSSFRRDINVRYDVEVNQDPNSRDGSARISIVPSGKPPWTGEIVNLHCTS